MNKMKLPPFFLTALDDGRQWCTDGKDIGFDPAAVPDLMAVTRDTINATQIAGEFCPTCGRDNRTYNNICTSDDCPGVAARTALNKAQGRCEHNPDIVTVAVNETLPDGVVEHQYVYGDTDTYGFTIDVFQGGGDRYQARSWEGGDTTDISYHPSVAKALEWIVEQLIEDAEGEESPSDEIHKGGFSHEENTPYDTPASHLLAAMNKQKSGDDDDAPIICINTNRDDFGEPLGHVVPPAKLMADTRSKDGEPFWQAVISNLWKQWREEDKDGRDEEFVHWLVDQHDWEYLCDSPHIINVEV